MKHIGRIRPIGLIFVLIFGACGGGAPATSNTNTNISTATTSWAIAVTAYGFRRGSAFRTQRPVHIYLRDFAERREAYIFRRQ